MRPKQKYQIGEKVKVNNWIKLVGPFEITDIQWIFHARLARHIWGYKLNGFTGLTMMYVPEGYLRKV